MSGAGTLAIMGSGETSPTMVKTHRALFEGRDGPAVLLDTPFGFQENADDIAAKATAYFAESVGRTVGIASFRSADIDALARESAFEPRPRCRVRLQRTRQSVLCAAAVARVANTNLAARHAR